MLKHHLLVAVALILMLSLVSSGVAMAASVEPTVIPGADNNNKTCAVVIPGTTELKIDGTTGDGPFSKSDGTLSVSVVKPSAGTTNPNSFDWEANIRVVGVIVKNGVDGANWYDYGPTGSIGDTYLTTPNDGAKGVSHISFCYYPQLIATKSATGSYDLTVNWSIDKSVSPTSHSGFAGQEVGQSTWTIAVTKTEVLDNYRVTGSIIITNPSSVSVDFSVSDTLDDGTEATVSCPSNSVAAEGNVTCTYIATPEDGSATFNTATVTSLTYGVGGATATVPVSFTRNLRGADSITLYDPRFDYDKVIAESTTSTFEETFTCPADEGQYKDGKHPFTATNLAYLGDNSDLGASAHVDVTCYRPTVVKDAIPSYTLTYAWELFKTVYPPTVDLFNGANATLNYTVTATRDSGTPGNWSVSGVISVTNPHPTESINLTGAIVDVIEGGVNANVSCPASVAPNTTATCAYSASLPDGATRLNTARLSLFGIVYEGSAVIDFANATPSQINASVTVNDSYDQTSSPWTFITSGQQAYSRPVDCSVFADESYTNGSASMTVVNTVSATLQDGRQLSDNANALLTCYRLRLTVQKTATPTERPEPGGAFTFDVVVVNNSPVPLIVTSINDSVYGDVTQVTGRMIGTTCALPQLPLPANGGQYSCSFTANLSGAPGFTETDVVTVSGQDSEGNGVSASDDATVAITDVPSSITLTKTADKNVLPWPGGDVIFTVQVQNTSAVDAVQINTLTDSIYGNITQVGGKVLATTCSVPLVLTPNAIFSCTFTVNLTLAAEVEANLVETNVVTATGVDDDGQPLQASDDETVTVLAAQLAVIGDRVFIDIDPGGRTSAEQLAGNQQQDFDANGQPIETNVAGIDILLFTADGVLVAQTKTGEDGFYRFDDVPPGEYYIVFVNNGVFMGAWTGHNAAIADDVDSDVDPSLPLDDTVEAIIDNLLGEGASLDAVRTPTFTVEPGQTYLDVDAGLVDLSGANSVDINGIVWLDANRDGIRQPDETTRIPGVIVELYRVTDGQPNQITKVDQMTTDGDGFYEFLGLDAGIYFVKVIIPPVYQITEQNAGDDSAIDNDVNPITGESELLVLSIETVVIDAGVYQTPTALEPIEEPALMSNWLYLPTVQR
ncbi:MAG: SdrD B-like domain-containing protein [Caldilinea sp.]